jgi:CheY-like chemotaxis protein
MPHLGGAELCHFLKGHPTLNRLPVVMLSALDPCSGAEGAALRPDVFLAKPVAPQELAACVGRLLARATSTKG